MLAGDAPVLAGSGSGFLAETAAAANLECEDAGGGATADIAIYARLAAQGRTFGSPPAPLYLRGPDARPQGGHALARAAT